MAKAHYGYCRLCGTNGKLSYEHIPPKSAFNDEQRSFKTFSDLMECRGSTKFRKGIGEYSLCEDCNNLTGGWYGTAFAAWTRQGLEGVDKLVRTGQKSIWLPYYIRPLNVIKQIVIMALAMQPEQTIPFSKELRSFVLNREQKYIPSSDRVYVYHSLRGQPRFASGMSILNTSNGAISFVRGEIALPPFGYSVSDPVAGRIDMGIAAGLCDITWFSKYDFDEYARVNLRIPGLETNTPVPFDYRTEDEMAKEALASLEEAEAPH